jgi:carboxynorspermidine decarboxylase
MPVKALYDIQTPAYVLDVAALRRNLPVMANIKTRTGVKILLATKAFSQFSAFPFMQDTLDGTTASGLYEARLGADYFQGEVHTYSPAFTEDELREVLGYSHHIYFNSISQLERFAPMVREAGNEHVVGLRVNPRLSLVKNSELYDPSAPRSRFGIQPELLTDEVLAQVDLLHFHNLCENLGQDSAALIDHVMSKFGYALEKVKAVNLGGGHFVTHPDYCIEELCAALMRLRKAYPHLEVVLEPGGAHVLNAGFLVTRVLDVVEGTINHAHLDTSASTHMPDVLEVPYRPRLIGSGEEGEKAHSYILGGRTCMAGDVIGSYSFDEKLQIGDVLIFEDMAQYAMVKNTNFNGVPLPDIGILHEDGRYELVKRFGYEDFKNRLS